jgi:hypothetical protein
VQKATAPNAAPAAGGGGKPNILFIMGDDIGWANISIYNLGIMGYRTPNIDRIGRRKKFGPRGVLHSYADGKIENPGR